jgi:hypothetical protein
MANGRGSGTGDNMALTSLGKIAITSGTPKQVSATTLNCNGAYFQFPFTGNTGPNAYIGTTGIVIATLANVLYILLKRAAATDPLDYWIAQSNVSAGPIDLSTIFIDGDHTGDVVLVSYLAV